MFISWARSALWAGTVIPSSLFVALFTGSLVLTLLNLKGSEPTPCRPFQRVRCDSAITLVCNFPISSDH
jgi:hypothetical protein